MRVDRIPKSAWAGAVAFLVLANLVVLAGRRGSDDDASPARDDGSPSTTSVAGQDVAADTTAPPATDPPPGGPTPAASERLVPAAPGSYTYAVRALFVDRNGNPVAGTGDTAEGDAKEDVTVLVEALGANRRAFAEQDERREVSYHDGAQWLDLITGHEHGGEERCDLEPAVRSLPETLAVGTGWEGAGACEATIQGAPFRIEVVIKGKVIGRETLTIGAARVDTWLVERTVSSRFRGTFQGKDVDQSTIDEERLHISARHGLIIRSVTTTTERKPDKRYRESRELRELPA